jgi:hypothetical protein
MKFATRLIDKMQKEEHTTGKKGKKSINEIVKETNDEMNASITAKTASRYVRNGLIGVSPMKKGPIGDLAPRIYKALKGAYTTYLKLEQSHSIKQSSIKEMSKLVNAAVNKAGFTKSRDDLAKKLQKDTAHHFDVGKANVMEQRRLQWTTVYNLNVWFSTWKDTLIELGFARKKLPDEEGVLGEVVFFDGQLERIGNIDETDGSLDDTAHQRGGRPSIVFTAPNISGGATAVNKSGYSSTIICGSNAKGKPFPPHFQLKTLAETVEGQRLRIDWIANSKNTIGKFGFLESRELPCTFGMNKKAGMNAVELDKYMKGSIIPLYPDIEDKPGKRIIVGLEH